MHLFKPYLYITIKSTITTVTNTQFHCWTWNPGGISLFCSHFHSLPHQEPTWHLLFVPNFNVYLLGFYNLLLLEDQKLSLKLLVYSMMVILCLLEQLVCVVILHFMRKSSVCASFLLYIISVNEFRHPCGSSIGCRLVFCLLFSLLVLWRVFVLRSSWLVWYVCVRDLCVFRLVGDFLSPPAMDPPVSKELSSSSSAIHSSERGERSYSK